MSALPSRKRSEEELRRLRFQHALAVRPPVGAIKAQTAHWFLLGLGYLLCFAGGVGGLLMALFIWLRKPRSRHHAALMLILATLVLVFGTLYYLPKTDAA